MPVTFISFFPILSALGASVRGCPVSGICRNLPQYGSQGRQVGHFFTWQLFAKTSADITHYCLILPAPVLFIFCFPAVRRPVN